MILITGASGQVGCAVIEALYQMNVETRAFIHSKQHEKAVQQAGATEVYIGDLGNEADLVAALRGVTAIYYISPAASEQEDEIGSKLIQLAKEQNIYFVYHSVLHSLLTEMPHHQRKHQVEQTLVNSGVDFTIIQPAVFMQMLRPAINSVANGGPLIQKFFSTPDTKMNFIDLTDLAAAVAQVLTHKATYLYATLELSSRESYTLSDLKRVFSVTFKRQVQSVFITDELFLKQSGLEPKSYGAQTLLTMFQHYNTHSFFGNDFVLRHILNRAPKTLSEFVKQAALQSEH